MDTNPNHASLFEEQAHIESMKAPHIYSPIYSTYKGFSELEKPDEYRAFFVTRDPRDLVVSWYFSAGWSHSITDNPTLGKVRSDLSRLNQNDGLLYSIDYLAEYGIFHAIDSWLEAEIGRDNLCCIKYEDLAGTDQFLHFRKLMDYLMIPIPDKALKNVLSDHSFKSSHGAAPQDGKGPGHNRKGHAGDWVNHLRRAHLDQLSPHVTKRMRKIGYGVG